MARDLVAVRARVRLRVRHLAELHAVVQLVALTRLDEEQLGLAGERWALLSAEVAPDSVRLVGGVGGVEDALLA